MKQVLLKTEELATVNLGNINNSKIYAFKNLSDDIFKACEYKQGIWEVFCIGIPAYPFCHEFCSLRECVEYYQKNHIIYEFKDQDDFFDNAREMKMKLNQ